MTAGTIALVDGRRLTQRRGSWRLDPPGLTVAVEMGSGVVTLTDPDNGQVLANQLAIAEGGEPNGQPVSRSRSKHGSRDDAGRWAALNAFVDVIAPRLTLTEKAVWFVMFRYARGGVCNTSERAIATQAGIDKATAGKALRSLVALGLVWPVFKSTSKGTSSRYGIHPRPDTCLPAVMATDDNRRQTGRQRREERGGDRRGRRSNAK